MCFYWVSFWEKKHISCMILIPKKKKKFTSRDVFHETILTYKTTNSLPTDCLNTILPTPIVDIPSTPQHTNLYHHLHQIPILYDPTHHHTKLYLHLHQIPILHHLTHHQICPTHHLIILLFHPESPNPKLTTEPLLTNPHDQPHAPTKPAVTSEELPEVSGVDVPPLMRHFNQTRTKPTKLTSSSASPGTRYPFSRYFSYKNLSPKYQIFLANITSMLDPKSYAEACKHPHWR